MRGIVSPNVGVDRHAVALRPRDVCSRARLAAQCRCVSVSNDLLELTTERFIDRHWP